MENVSFPNSSTNHFSQGLPCPEVNPNIVRLYSMKFCPYAQRTRLVLAAKKIENEVVNINLEKRPDWFYTKNPLGKVPCLEFDGNKLLYESLITCDYLDEVYPSRALNSKDPFQKAQDRIFVELFNKISAIVSIDLNGNYMKKLTAFCGSYRVISNFYKLTYATKPEDGESGWKEPLEALLEGLQIFEEELLKRGTPFYGGYEPGMLDYMIWPWMERLPLISLVYQGAINVEDRLNKFPKLVSWTDDMKKDDAVKESYVSPENHYKYFKTRMSPEDTDYDVECN